MLTDSKIVGDWMEKYNEDGEEAIKDVEGVLDYADCHYVP